MSRGELHHFLGHENPTSRSCRTGRKREAKSIRAKTNKFSGVGMINYMIYPIQLTSFTFLEGKNTTKSRRMQNLQAAFSCSQLMPGLSALATEEAADSEVQGPEIKATKPGFVFLVIFYFWPYLRAFWGLCFIFSRVLKQIQEKLSQMMSIMWKTRM